MSCGCCSMVLIDELSANVLLSCLTDFLRCTNLTCSLSDMYASYTFDMFVLLSDKSFLQSDRRPPPLSPFRPTPMHVRVRET